MLIKITENQFINIHRCVIVEFFFDKDETAIELVADTESEGSVSLDKSCLNLEILEYHLYSNNFIKLGDDIINTSKISSIKIDEEATISISFGNNLDYKWEMSEVSEKEIKDLFKCFHIESVVRK